MNYKKHNNKAYDCNSKVLLIGDSSVGKTSIMMRFANDNFSPSFIATIGIDFKTKIIEVSGSKIKLQIWDTAGQERFRAITTSYYKGANVIIIVYNVCDESSFENVTYWMQTINEFINCTSIILVGNKIDMQSSRKIPFIKGHDLAKKYNIPFFECSAKKNININLIFEEAGRIHLKNVSKIISGGQVIYLKSHEKKGKKCCS